LSALKIIYIWVTAFQR